MSVLIALLLLQDAVEIKTNDGAAAPQVRLSITSGATTADVWVRRGRLKFDAANGYLNVSTPAAVTPDAGDLRFDGSNLLLYTTSWQTVTTTASNLWQDSGTYISASGNSNARAYDSGQRYVLWGTQTGTTAGTSWYSDSYAGLFGENGSSADNQSYHAGVIGAIRNNPVASLANAGVVGLRHDGAGGVPTWGALAIKTAAGEMAAVYGSTTHVATTVYGVYGSATGAATTNYGVYGTASGAGTNWAGYFNGNANITGNLQMSTNGAAIYFTGSTLGSDAIFLYSVADRLVVRAEDTSNVAQFASYGLYLPQDPGICLYAGGDIRLGYASGADNDTIYFDAGDRTLTWNEAGARFEFSAWVDVFDRCRVRQGPGGTAGIWFYQTTPAADRAFVGMVNDTTVGFYGNTGAGWGLQMNTTTGNVGVGSAPTSDKVYSLLGSSTNFPVYGDNDNAAGTGVYGNGEGSGFSYFTTGAGVQGWGDEFGVMGRGQTAGTGGGGYFDNFTGSPYAYVGYYNGTSYKIVGTGTVSTIVRDTNGNRVTLHAPEAPEVVFEDYGIADLSGGRIRVKLDPILVKNIRVDRTHPLRVYLQPYGECQGVFVENATADGFDAVEMGGGRSSVKVAWRIVANRADSEEDRSKYSTLRFERAPEPQPTR